MRQLSIVRLHGGLGRHALGAPRPRPPYHLAAATTTIRFSRTTRRCETTVTGDQNSGHIYSGANEAILFFDNLYPLKLASGPLSYLALARAWKSDDDLGRLLKGFNRSSLGLMDPINLVKRTIPNDGSVKVTELIPRLKDGGCFVKVAYPSGTSPEDIESKLSRQLQHKPIKPWFNPFRSIKVGLVTGVPWLEDMARYPRSRLKIEFLPKEPGAEAAELSQESLFALFRKYGKIADIISQPSDSKVLPKFAYLDFAFTRDAIMARNCLHGILVPDTLGGGKAGTKLSLSYEQKVRAHHIWDWISNHPRIVIPIIAALLAGITVLVFDPIREFFIKAHIQKSFSLSDSKIFQWFKKRTGDILVFRRNKAEDAGLKALFSHRRDAIEQINTWLMESADTFIVVQGPRGSGKQELVLDQALGARRDVLVVDCKPIVEAKGESATIKKLAGEVGYRPVFSWANQLSSLIDLAIQSTTGVKSGFSETFDSQLSKILANTAAALKRVSVSDRKREDGDANLSDDAFLEAHPERRAVVVIDNFLLKNEETSIVYDKLSDWAAALVQANIAHVVFLTSDTSYSKPLSKSLPDRVFRTIALGDLSPEVAKQYVLSHLSQTKLKHEEAQQSEDTHDNSEDDNEKNAPKAEIQESPKNIHQLDEVITVLGGRLTDLEFLARRMKTGQTPRQAVQEIIDQSASEILKLFLLANRAPNRKFSTEQAWHLIQEIAKKESLRYHEVLLSNTFASSTTPGAEDGELALENLANAELITVHSHRGRPQTIMAGKPVYQAAFAALVKDPVLKAKMNLNVLTELTKVEGKTIEKVESELSLLGSLPRQPYETVPRINYLLAKLSNSQNKIRDYELEMAKLKLVLAQEA
ncbi:RNA12 protein [Coniella lustricola]|uniref:Mitochondrial escape protein 2 n=1 Tax=Coniella lustricola TaxID=2025994 RepID=A0A2T3A968_9PEZI|nr:RNA12 protein [Coniella lustricola]